MSPDEEISALVDIAKHPAWPLLRAKFAKYAEETREASMMAEDDKKANELRVAWRMIAPMEPEKVRTLLITIKRRELAAEPSAQPVVGGQ